MIPRPSVGQATMTGGASTVTGVTAAIPGFASCSAAVKVDEVANQGGVAWMPSVKVVGTLRPSSTATSNCVLEAPGSSEQAVFGQAKSEGDGGIAVQPGGIEKVTSRTGAAARAGAGVGAGVGAVMAGTVKVRVSGVWVEA